MMHCSCVCRALDDTQSLNNAMSGPVAYVSYLRCYVPALLCTKLMSSLFSVEIFL